MDELTNLANSLKSVRHFRSLPLKDLLIIVSSGQVRRVHAVSPQHSINALSARIVTVPEAISRAINAFSTAGFITANRTRIEVLDPEGLADLAQIQFE